MLIAARPAAPARLPRRQHARACPDQQYNPTTTRACAGRPAHHDAVPRAVRRVDREAYCTASSSPTTHTVPASAWPGCRVTAGSGSSTPPASPIRRGEGQWLALACRARAWRRTPHRDLHRVGAGGGDRPPARPPRISWRVCARVPPMAHLRGAARRRAVVRPRARGSAPRARRDGRGAVLPGPPDHPSSGSASTAVTTPAAAPRGGRSRPGWRRPQLAQARSAKVRLGGLQMR